MTVADTVLLAVLIFAAAMLYSSVGHAGASGYLAAMALVGVAPTVMRPTALVLNVLVAAIATIRYGRAGAFSFGTLWPFALGSIPFAFVGGAVHLPSQVYKPVVGGILLVAAAQLVRATTGKRAAAPGDAVAVPVLPAVASGGVIGLLSGLTGTGGGIFLSPLLLFTGWARARRSAGISAAFILVNSLAGLAGNLTSVGSLPAALPVWALAAVVGGTIGSELGSRRLANPTILRLLALVLVIAGLKLILA